MDACLWQLLVAGALCASLPLSYAFLAFLYLSCLFFSCLLNNILVLPVAIRSFIYLSKKKKRLKRFLQTLCEHGLYTELGGILGNEWQCPCSCTIRSSVGRDRHITFVWNKIPQRHGGAEHRALWNSWEMSGRLRKVDKKDHGAMALKAGRGYSGMFPAKARDSHYGGRALRSLLSLEHKALTSFLQSVHRGRPCIK